MMEQRLTEKKMKNRKFRKVEEAILGFFCAKGFVFGLDKAVKEIGIARSTFYHHHRTMADVLPDYRRYILRKYNKMINRIMHNKNARVKIVYLNIIIFIVQHRDAFELLLRDENVIILNVMIDMISEKMMRRMGLTQRMRKIYSVYNGEVTRILYEWIETGADIDESGRLLSDIIYLTQTAKQRLAPIENN